MSIQKGRKGGPLKRQLTILITLFSENRQQKEERGQKKMRQHYLIFMDDPLHQQVVLLTFANRTWIKNFNGFEVII